MSAGRLYVLALFLAAAACGGGDSSQSASEHPTSAAPATSSAGATSAVTTTPETTATQTTDTSTTTAAPATSTPSDGDLSSLVDIPGYTLGDRRPGGVWSLGEGTEAGHQSVFVDGSWVGLVTTMRMRDSSTEEAWASFVDSHHAELPVLTGGEPALTNDSLFALIANAVPAWELFGVEPVLSAYSGDRWAGLWHHDGEVWGVSGDERARTYAAQLALAQQSADNDVVEPEQVDIDVVEGPLWTLFEDAEEFVTVDWAHADVMGGLAEWGGCIEHFAGHWIHRSTDPRPVTEFDEGDVDVLVGLWSDLCDPFTLEQVVAANPGFELTDLFGQPAAHSDTAWILTAGDVVVEIHVTDPKTLETFAPMITHLLETAPTLS